MVPGESGEYNVGDGISQDRLYGRDRTEGGVSRDPSSNPSSNPALTLARTLPGDEERPGGSRGGKREEVETQP